MEVNKQNGRQGNVNINDFSWPGNVVYTFKNVQVAGNVTISASNVLLFDSNSSIINQNHNLDGSTVIEGAPVTNPEPSNPTTPTTPDTPSTPTNPSEPTTLEFSDTNEKMYVSKAVNFRQNYTTNSGRIKTLEAGTEVTRLGVSKGTNEGYSWSKISYNGVTGYVATEFLTYDKPEETPPEEPETPETPETPEEVDPNQEKISKISEELGAIPEVGLNIATFIFFGSSIVCVIMMVEVKRKIAK